jgi:hypothetical protein
VFDHLFFFLGDIELLNLTLRAPGQDESEMLFTLEAFTVGFPTDDVPEGSGGAEELPITDQRLKLGAALAFGFRHTGSMHGWTSSLIYIIYIRH